MAFISLSPELKAKSFTGIENKFITKYMPVLDPARRKGIYIWSVPVRSFGLVYGGRPCKEPGHHRGTGGELF